MTDYELEDYKFAKQELLSVINLQYTILSILVTASAAVFVFVLDKGETNLSRIIFCGCLIIPGIYAFFGVLWLDQIYRQRRLASYIFEIETTYEFNRRNSNGSYSRTGWEHFIQKNKRDRRTRKKNSTPSREYYYICIGLFLALPAGTYLLIMHYTDWTCFAKGSEYLISAIIGIVMYVLFIIFAIPYIRSIKKLSNSFSEAVEKVMPNENQTTEITSSTEDTAVIVKK